MKKSFFNYLEDTDKDYVYTIKIASKDGHDVPYDCIKKCLEKYEVKSVGKMAKTILQEHPLDFPNITCAEVYIIETTLYYPVTPNCLRLEISKGLSKSESEVLVEKHNDPRRLETILYLDRQSDSFKENYKPVLGEDGYTEEEVVDHKDYYGEEHLAEVNRQIKEENARRREKYNIVNNDLSCTQVTDSEGVSGTDDSSPNTTSVIGTKNINRGLNESTTRWFRSRLCSDKGEVKQ